MKDYIVHDVWSIIEKGFDPHNNKVSESIFSIGNGRMGQRANFEEQYSGEMLLGNYVAGVYYPDKTKVGWWKNGYPEYFAKILNAANWTYIHVNLNGIPLDLSNCKIHDFERRLDMQAGILFRSFHATTNEGIEVKVQSTRFCSIKDDENAAIKYEIEILNKNCSLTLVPGIDADVENQDSNYDEKFWDEVTKLVKNDAAYVVAETKKTNFHVATGMAFDITKNGEKIEFDSERVRKKKFGACKVTIEATKGEKIVLYKYIANLSSENHPKDALLSNCQKSVKKARTKGFEKMKLEQSKAWNQKWEKSDIVIEGDAAAQQGIRFNIFQLNQTYTGQDERLNIGPKGFTGEKYGGSTYWDTEAYCLPFYLSMADQKVARNLLVYRYKHLPKAIENATKLGFENGAALYPMVTINGEECHNEWEITFEEIHRNGAIAYAIFDYIRYTEDNVYLAEYGLETLIGIARFWAQRIHYSTHKRQYVMHGVTGPNEYENNVDNNWYTNYIACWCMRYTTEAFHFVKDNDTKALNRILKDTHFDTEAELEKWKDITDNMFYPKDNKLGIFLQQETYLDKDLLTINDLRPEDRPINQKWSWDRILRSCFIKQADVLQGLYFFEEDFNKEIIKRNFDFYEPRTVHESSLSPCIHVILATMIDNHTKAYEMYLRTSRLDLDDYNNDTEDGLHITSMAGTWLSVVKGFGGMRIKRNKLNFSPYLPEQWTSMAFKVQFRGNTIELKMDKKATTIVNHSKRKISIIVFGKNYVVNGNASVSI
jgi:maltose phosphorylase